MKKSGLFALLILFVSWASFGQNSDKFKKEGKNSQTIVVNQTISESTEIFPFGQNGDIIYGLDASADIELNSDNSLVRLLLVDNNFNEYLIYESYNLLLEDGKKFSIKDICEETSILDGVKPYSIEIEIENAQLKLKSLSYSTGIDSNIDVASVKKEKKKGQNEIKINKLNKNLKKKGKHWVAGETSVSELNYGQRKKLYGQSTFPAGFEYYVGGVISAGSTESASTDDGTLKSATTTTESPYVKEWDWRDRHGKNWVSPVTNQEYCGSCWAFASTGATEALVNLYFNKQLNLDLSEQDLVSCSGGGSCDGGYPYIALDYISSIGIVDEATFPYSATNEACTNKGSNPNELIKIGGKVSFGTTECPATEDNLKKLLINYGPVSGGLYDWLHAMTLVGYKTVEEGDQFFYRDLNLERYWVTIESGDPLIGKTVWIFKNSWGENFGDLGYVYVETDITNIGWTHALKTPVISQVQNYDVTCEDADGDGYYWWGLGEKPANCPECPDLADGDDSDPTKGPLDEYGYCITLDGSTIPVAMFSADNTEITTSETITFDDQSLNNPTSWSWIFEGGNPATSEEQNPSVLYSAPGTYKVSLTAANSDGSDTKVVEGYIEVSDPAVKPIAYFSANPTSVSTGGTVTFTDLSINTPTSWSWSFQGGSPATSTEQNPQVTYSTTGSYIVALTVTNDAGSNTKLIRDYIVVSGQTATPVANFSASETSINTDETVTFSDLSTNTPTSWDWTFEGGSPSTSTAQNPTVTYSTAGTYQVTLTATNADGSNTKSVDNYITVTEPVVAPAADFSASETSVNTNETVTFTDLSTNTPTSWSWAFEGGTPATSTEQNPTVSYTTAGTYKVTLTATNAGGSNTKSVDNYITVTEPVVAPAADFSASETSVNTNETVTFTDLSTNTPTSWSWTFEGGTPATSTAQNPTVTYTTAGSYNVTLTATNAGGSNTKSIDNYITVTEPVVAPVANFSGNPRSVTEGETVTFSDLSTNTPTSWEWTFEGGDPATSTEQNPTVTYYTANTYSVTLTVTNQAGSNTQVMENYIEVTKPVVLPVADFSANNTSVSTDETVSFTDLSSDASSWSWTFEGGTPATSILQNPSVSYATAGNYKVTLVATNNDGSDTKSVDNYIQVNEAGVAPAADFSADNTSITTGETVTFSDLSTNEPTSWSWIFDGGTPGTSTQQNPTVTYNSAGTYKVTLTATNDFGSDIKTVDSYIEVNDPLVLPVADFSADNTSLTTEETVTFTDLTSNDPVAWNWTFEGGNPATSTQQNPTVTYSSAGTYNVTLTATNADGTDTKTVYNYIEVTEQVIAPVAEFSANVTTITEGETVTFNDLSSNEPTSWSWTFEGGTPSTSTAKNPSVTYATAGTYSVTLVVSNEGGSDTKTVESYIKVEEYVPSYCIPTTDASIEWIAGVDIDGQSNTSGSNGYTDFSSIVFELVSGDNQTIVLSPGFSSRSKFEYWAVWIDFDKDMTFSDSEKVLSSKKSKSEITESISIPGGLNITTRMRVALSPTVPSACSDLIGEVEDYTVHIYEPAPVADFTASSTNVTVGESVQFTNTSLYNPTSLVWNFEGLTASASSVEDPVVSYDTPGEYLVTLTASNDLGTSQKSMKITVSDQDDNTTVDYCTPDNVSSSLNYIRRVVFAGYDIESGADGYGLSTSIMDNIEAGQNYVAELYPYSNTTRNYWKVWIDYNNDGDFDDSGEMVLEINNKKGMVSGNITVPSDVFGTTRMRVVLNVGSAPLTPCDDNFVGEVEDYTITINEAMPQAQAPSENFELEQNTITVYPNPTANYINISIDEIGFDDAYSIYDVSGKKVIQGQIISSSTRVDLTEYPSGIYLVKVLNYNQTTIKKIIKKD